MASLIQDPSGRSPYWICVCSASANGRPKRVWRTTKIRLRPLDGAVKPGGSPVTARDLRLKAEQVCHAIEQSIELERQAEVTEANLRRILSETLERVEGRPLAHPSVAEWLDQWIETRKGAISERTRLKYVQVKDAFLKSLGRRRHAKLGSIGLKDFLEFRNELLAEGRTPQTVDQLVRKILASPFALAVKLALLDSNPVASLPPLKSTRIEKGTFTAKEISKLLRQRLLIGAERSSVISLAPGSKTFATSAGVTSIWKSGSLHSGPEGLASLSQCQFIPTWKRTCFRAISRMIRRLSSFVRWPAKVVAARAGSPWRSNGSWNGLESKRALPG
jgi:hypothetical protein